MESTLAIANELVSIANRKKLPITPMQLLKQVYFAHGWYLALTGESLLDERVEAWQFGPVESSVYHAFKDFKSNQITEPATVFDPEKLDLCTPKIDPEKKNLMRFLEKISDTYGKMSGVQLSNLTHQPDSPWYVVWNERGGKDRKHTEIPDDLIKDYFCKKITPAPSAAS
jgi:uncharacterized phage-associated protein